MPPRPGPRRSAYLAALPGIDPAAAVAGLEADVDLAQRSEDIAAGRAPVWARRALFAHEVAAKVSFAAIDDGTEAAAVAIARRLAADRAQLAALVANALAARGSGTEAVRHLLLLEVSGLAAIPGARALLEASASDIAATLVRSATAAGAAALAEALAQGAPLAALEVGLSAAAGDQLAQVAARTAQAPLLDALRAIREALVVGATPVTAAEVATAAAQAVTALADAPLVAYGRQAAAQAIGLGRQAVTELATPAQVYASELLDSSTCGPCSLIDGHLYDTVAAARADYPVGIYRNCEGAARCRGTLVFVWAPESPPSLAVPGTRSR